MSLIHKLTVAASLQVPKDGPSRFRLTEQSLPKFGAPNRPRALHQAPSAPAAAKARPAQPFLPALAPKTAPANAVLTPYSHKPARKPAVATTISTAVAMASARSTANAIATAPPSAALTDTSAFRSKRPRIAALPAPSPATSSPRVAVAQVPIVPAPAPRFGLAIIKRITALVGRVKQGRKPATSQAKKPIENIIVVRNNLHDCDVEVVAKSPEPPALSTFKLEGPKAAVAASPTVWRRWSDRIQIWKANKR
jgi:hypothetical protein